MASTEDFVASESFRGAKAGANTCPNCSLCIGLTASLCGLTRATEHG
eukprot:COSAG03_NODE_1296_length_4380_cov_28.563390_7_plen_47_part_00